MYEAIIWAILAGVFTALESNINSQLGKQITPSIATLHNLATGTIMMAAVSIVRGSLSRYARVFSVKPVFLIGGLFGAMIIYLSSRAIPVLGVAKSLTLILAAQIIAGIAIDAVFGGVPINGYKICGVLFLLLGANLIMRQ